MVAKLIRVAVLATVVVALGVASPSLAQAPKWEGDPVHYQLELRAWFPLDLRASTYSPGLGPEDTLVLDETVRIAEENIPELRFSLLPSPANRVRFGYTRIRFEGHNVVPGTFLFNGAQFGGGDDVVVAGEIKQDYWYINWACEPFEAGDETFRLGFVLGVHGWKSKIKLFNSAPAVAESKQFDNLFPAVGLAFDWTPSKYVTVFFEGSGVNQSADGWHLDAEGGVKISLAQVFAIVVSYRQLEISNEEHDSDWFGRWTVRGPFVGVDFRL